jgi:hypothetical protein
MAVAMAAGQAHHAQEVQGLPRGRELHAVRGLHAALPPGDCTKCGGGVRNGKCLKCQQTTDGNAAYSWTMCVQDHRESKEDVFLKIAGSAGAGTSLFKLTADEFSNLSDTAKCDKIESVAGETFAISAFIQYDERAGDVFVCSYGFSPAKA